MSGGNKRRAQQRLALNAVVGAAVSGIEAEAYSIMGSFGVEGAEMMEDVLTRLNDIRPRVGPVGIVAGQDDAPEQREGCSGH